MKYIIKQKTPQFFIDDTKNLTKWDDYIAEDKRKLKAFILNNEQFCLCCYCEKQITIDNTASHVEHLKPKSIYTSLTFDYNNLSVSCEGKHLNYSDKNTCGQKKGDVFDEQLFLNPTLEKDISDYFIFDTDTGVILPSSKNKNRAEYMINLTNLNGDGNRLAQARINAKKALISSLSNITDLTIRKQKLSSFLENSGSEFITFFKYIFKSLIQ